MLEDLPEVYKTNKNNNTSFKVDDTVKKEAISVLNLQLCDVF